MNTSLKSLAAVVALMAAAPLVQAVNSLCEQQCAEWASTQAAQERDKVRGDAPVFCAQVPPSNYQQCIAGRYAYAEYVYSTVYQSAYSSCMKGHCGE
jgi:hypothetical protein